MLILVVDGSMLVTERMTEGLSEVRNISSIHRALFYEEAQKLLKENKYDIVQQMTLNIFNYHGWLVSKVQRISYRQYVEKKVKKGMLVEV